MPFHRSFVRIVFRTVPAIALALIVTGCGNGSSTSTASKAKPKPAPADLGGTFVRASKLPAGLVWLTNTTDPVYASPDAVKGGTFHEALLSFPLTFRTVGPDSNSSFRSAILDNHLSLIGIHPNTLRIVPQLATHWAFGADKKTMYFKLNPKARWSDGVPVTARDFAYTLYFMRSKHIVAPWYNDYYSREIDHIIIYDDHTLAVVAKRPVPDLYLRIAIGPTPAHYFGALGNDFVRKYNWAIVPNTGPYQISGFEKGRYIRFKRKTDWWGKDLRYFKNRFNVDTVEYRVIQDFNLQWEYFKKAQLDTFPMTLPSYWHVKSKTPVIQNGDVERLWFFNDTPRSATGMWLNLDRPIFKDRRVRYAFAHAMNVGKVIHEVLRNDYYRLEQGFMGYGPYTDNTIRARRFDLQKVTQYMTEAGWHRGPDGIWTKNGQRFSVEVTYGFAQHTPRLVVLKEEAQKAGIELRLDQLDPAAAYKKVMEKKDDVASMGWSTSLRPQYWEFFDSANAHKPQTNNITNTDDPAMDRLITAYRNSLDEKDRIRLSKEIQERIHAIGCFVPTFMVPYVRAAYWRWWRLPDPPGTRESDSLFDPFNADSGGLFWFDKARYDATQAAMSAGKPFAPVTRVDKTYEMTALKH